MVGDETALPAIGRCLEELPAGHRCLAVIEVEQRSHIQPLPSAAEVEAHWVVRAEGGGMVEAVRGLDFPKGEAYAWVAGEAGNLRQLRRDLKERGVAPENLEVTGYWRQREVADSEEPQATGYAMYAQLAALLDPVPGFAVRAAIRAGVFSAIADAPEATLAVLARTTGITSDALRRLLRYLQSLDLVVYDGHAYALTALSRELADEDSHLVEHLAGVAAQRTLAVAGIEEVLRTGAPRPVPYDAAEWEEETEEAAQWVAPALAEALGSPGPVVVAGPGAGVYAEECARRGMTARAVPLAQAPAERAGLLVLLDPFDHLGGEELADYLRRVKAAEVVVLTKITPQDNNSEHDFAEDIVRLCQDGTRVPTAEDIDAVAAKAGWAVRDTARVGWSSTLVRLGR
nr:MULTISPECIES: SIP domain-containing protein [unclassified Corynebacterium]